MYYKRDLNIIKILDKKSVFLFGPRGTGKSSLLLDQLGQRASLINLLKSSEFLRLSQNPSLLEDMIESFGKPWVIIDEIQKLPLLLDEVHRLIETKKYKFVLTGSSARKLKRGGANLLAGRAWQSDMLPLTSHEISDFRLDRYLRYGGLPAVYTSKDPIEELDAYVNTYLYEEIQAEGLVRKLTNFSRFLKTAALLSGQLINYQNIANDSGVKVSTVKDYLQILNDTLVGFLVEPWLESKKRKAIATAKFYFFDVGVTHAINGTKSLDRNSNLYGQSFEHFIAQELRAYISYKRLKSPLLFWRSTSQFEVDFLLNEEIAIEVKATQKVNSEHIKGLKALQVEKKLRRFILVSQDKIQTKSGGIESLHWENFLKKLWNDELM